MATYNTQPAAPAITTGTSFQQANSPYAQLTPQQQQAYQSWSMGRGANIDAPGQGFAAWQAAGMPATYSAQTPGLTSGAGGGDFGSQIRQALQQANPGADPNYIESQVQYYQGKKASSDPDEASRPDSYWLMRAGLTPQQQATYGQQGGQTLGQMSGYSPNAQNGVASFSAPGLAAPYTKEFQPTDINTILNAPAFQAAQANGIDQIGRSAAGKGTLLTGQFPKDLLQYGEGLSLGALNDQFNRDATTYGTNRDTFNSNKTNAFNVLNGFANTGASIANQAGGYGSGYATGAQDNANNAANLTIGQGNNNAAATGAQAANTNNAITGTIKNASGIDWSSVFNTPQRAVV